MRDTARFVGLTVLACALALGGLINAVGAQQEDKEWVSLFDGKTLDGWLPVTGQEHGWKVVDGILTNAQPGVDLITDRTLTDCELHIEFRVPQGGNSGVYLQGRYEVQVADTAGAQDLNTGMGGAVYSQIAPTTNAAKPAGEWQTYDLTFIAPRCDRDGKVTENARITVVYNGEKVVDNGEITGPTGGEMDDNVSKPGPLLLQGNHTFIEYRNIRYRPLRVDWPDEALFTPLFDGKTTAGWHTQQTGHGTGGLWKVVDGVLCGTQDKPANGGLLMSDGLYGDFEIRADINPDWDIDSGLFLRTADSGAAYQVRIDYRPTGQVGPLYGEGIGGWSEDNAVWEKFYRRGEWNEIRAIITGQPPHIQVWINANLVNDYWDTEQRLPAEGRIALQVHGGGDWQGRMTRFRSIRILPLITGPQGPQ